MAGVSAYLLRTLASVAPGTRVVDVACGAGDHAEALARLGFDVWASTEDAALADAARARLADALEEDDAARRVSVARPETLGYPDAFAPWAVATDLDAVRLAEVFAEARRVLIPGGWLWTDTPGADPGLPVEERLEADRAVLARLAEAARDAGLAVASRPVVDEARGTVVAIFRRVDADTVG